MKKILVLTDFSEAARAAASFSVLLAGRCGARLVLINAWLPHLQIEVRDIAAYPLEAEWQARHDPHGQLHAEALRLEQLQEKIQPARPAVIETLSFRGSLPRALEANLATIGPDLIVAGLDTATSAHIIRNKITPLNYPLLLVPSRTPSNDFVKTIAFATDLQAGDRQVLLQLKRISAAFQMGLTICHVSEPAFNMAAAEELKIAGFMQAMALAGIPWSAYEQCYGVSVPQRVALFAKNKHAGLLALVHHGLGWLPSVWSDDNEAAILAINTIPVLLMPATG